VIRTNLSTRPFYNERAVHLWLLIAALLVVIATFFNVTWVLRYSRSDTELASQARRDEARAADLRQQAARLRGTLDMKQIDAASDDARQANNLIDRRTFSWTELFNRFEITLPDEVRITAVRPRLDPKRGIMIGIVVVARGVEDVRQFIENLQGTGAFTAVAPVEEHFDEGGFLVSNLEAAYVPDKAPVQPASDERAARR
jgi:Tfp pilus assembly protein PilN